MTGAGAREHVDATPDLPEEKDVFDDEDGVLAQRKPGDDPGDEPEPPQRHPHHNQYVKYIRAPHPDYRDRVNPFE